MVKTPSLLARITGIDPDNPDLIQAQFQAMSRQIPLLYVVLTICTLAVCVTYASVVPVWLSVWLPCAVCAVGLIRGLWWWAQKDKTPTTAFAQRNLRSIVYTTPILSVALTAWGLLLMQAGDADERGQVSFYMGMTVMACIFCLQPVRNAALIAMVLVNVPYTVFALIHPEMSLRSIAINLVLVALAMAVMLRNGFRDFANLVESRRSLIEQNAQMQVLSDDNFRIANLDSLTDLPNRRHFFCQAERLHEKARAAGERYAIGVIDLDGFKPVNDTYGHMVGDRLLIEVSQRLRDLCVADVFLARLGGDEFGLVITGDPTERDLVALGRRIGEQLRLPYMIGQAQAQVASSIGFAMCPDSADNVEALFERADYALYYAKRHSRGQVVLFDARHEEQIRTNSRVEQALLKADLARELELVYQPIVDARTRTPTYFEALARWHSPELGTVSPGVFIPAAERAGVVRSLTAVLLEKALMAAKLWPDHIGLSFNLSAHDLCEAEGVLAIIAAVNRSGIDPRRIDFEITETALAYDFEQAHMAVTALRALGAGISLDDFGTGFSSLTHVHRLPLSKIKVDRSFVTDINDNAVSHNIVKSLTTLCRDMALDCVIEGVETDEQLDTLREMGSTLIQGYLFARPMRPEAVDDYLGAALKKAV